MIIKCALCGEIAALEWFGFGKICCVNQKCENHINYLKSYSNLREADAIDVWKKLNNVKQRRR